MLTVERLAWDSDFFGFTVGRLSGQVTAGDDLAQALTRGVADGIRLTYGHCKHGDEAAAASCLLQGGRRVDTKCTYVLLLAGLSAPPAAPEPDRALASHPCDRRRVRSLAWKSAQYSRFRVDPDMPARAWRRLYTAWAHNSLNGQFADAVLVERRHGGVVGMVSVSVRQGRGSIGLLAVDTHHRGQGLGQRLLEAACRYCISAGCGTLEVVTQGDNLAACGLYERAGYALADAQAVFHFWTPRP